MFEILESDNTQYENEIFMSRTSKNNKNNESVDTRRRLKAQVIYNYKKNFKLEMIEEFSHHYSLNSDGSANIQLRELVQLEEDMPDDMHLTIILKDNQYYEEFCFYSCGLSSWIHHYEFLDKSIKYAMNRYVFYADNPLE